VGTTRLPAPEAFEGSKRILVIEAGTPLRS